MILSLVLVKDHFLSVQYFQNCLENANKIFRSAKKCFFPSKTQDSNLTKIMAFDESEKS